MFVFKFKEIIYSSLWYISKNNNFSNSMEYW